MLSRVLQQHQLGLHLHLEAAGGLEQAQQGLAEGDVLQRAVEDRLADTARIAASNSSTRVWAGTQPASMSGQRHAPVVALEEGQEVGREVVFVGAVEVPMMPKSRRCSARGRAVGGDEDVARVHVGVEEAVAEDLGEEDLDAGPRQGLEVDAVGAGPSWEMGCPSCAPSPSRWWRTSPSAPRAPPAARNPLKLRRSWEQLAASRIRSSSSRRYLENSATTSRGLRRRPSGHTFSSTVAAASRRPGRGDDRGDARAQDLTATRCRRAARRKCTWAIEAEATGSRSKRAKTSSTGLP